MSPWRRSPGPDNLPPSTVKRRHERYLLSTPLTARVREGQDETKIQTHALDISETGIGTLSFERWGAGVRVDLDVMLPQGSARLEVQAIVRHQTGMRCGLEFVDMSPKQQETVGNTCKFLAASAIRRGTPKPQS
jgi:c-di-GMP-binding flagellar brake protein YcgR